MRSADRSVDAIWLLAILALAAVVYWPGVGGPFVFDDVERILRAPALALTALAPDRLLDAALSGQQSYPNRGLSRLSFALNHYFAGGAFDPRAFKITNLAIHLTNGLLVYLLSTLLVRRLASRAPPGEGSARPRPAVRWLPLIVCAVWLLHPIQLTAVLYVVQRMTSLAATFVFSGLVVFVLGRARFAASRRLGMTLMLLGLAAGTGLGFLSKENAVLLPVFALLIDLAFFRAEWSDRRRRGTLVRLYALVVVLPLAALLAASLLVPEFARFIFAGFRDLGYGVREQLLTQPRILLFYLGLLLVPDIRRFGLFHDDIATSSGWLTPPTTLPSLAVLIILGLLALRGLKRGQGWSFGVLWFLAGHGIESTVLPLELVHEHRNYVPSFGIAFTAVLLLLRAGEESGRRRRLAVALAGATIAALATTTYVRASEWRSTPTLLAAQVRHHPSSYRARFGFAADGLPANADVGIRYRAFQRAARARDRAVAPLIEMAKLAEGALAALSRGARPEAPPPEADRTRGLLDAPLAANRAYLGRVRERVAAAIRGRLAANPVDTESAIALVGLADCVIGGGDLCRGLRRDAVAWHRIAIAGPGNGPEVRAVLELSLAKLYASAGRSAPAIRHARRAGRLAPGNLRYRLVEARLYALLDAWDEVGRVLAELDAAPRRRFLRREFDRLREDYRRRSAARPRPERETR